jgi:hypothetical protein
MSMRISRDALEIASLFAFLTGIFVGAGLFGGLRSFLLWDGCYWHLSGIYGHAKGNRLASSFGGYGASLIASAVGTTLS